MLNLLGSFENLRSSSLSRNYNDYISSNENYLPLNSSIRMPIELYRRIDDTMDMEE